MYKEDENFPRVFLTLESTHPYKPWIYDLLRCLYLLNSRFLTYGDHIVLPFLHRNLRVTDTLGSVYELEI